MPFAIDVCYHIYQDIWSAEINSKLPCHPESGNREDRYADLLDRPAELVFIYTSLASRMEDDGANLDRGRLDLEVWVLAYNIGREISN